MTFEYIAEFYKDFALKKFDTESYNAVLGLIREAKELHYELVNNTEKNFKLIEMADVQFYLLYCLYKEGFTLEDLISSMDVKLSILKNRKWKQNPDNTYSHI